MKKAYLLVYSESVGTREEVKKWADESSLVITWRYELPSSFYLVSEASAGEISRDMINTLANRQRHLIVEITDNRQGILPSESWYLFRNKKHKPE